MNYIDEIFERLDIQHILIPLNTARRRRIITVFPISTRTTIIKSFSTARKH